MRSHTIRSVFVSTLLMTCATGSALLAGEAWVASPWITIKPSDSKPADAPKELVLVGPRNGVAVGMVIARGGEDARMSALTGPSQIPATAIRMSYATCRQDLAADAALTTVNPYFDALSPQPVAGTDIQPIYVSVSIPADSIPGDYTGTVTANGVAIPLRLRVGAFVLPSAENRSLWVGTPQSPDTVALRYGLKPNSPEHLARMEPSLQIAGRMGANVMWVPIVGKSYLGTRSGLITFSRDGKNLKPNFTAFDTYFAMWRKHCGNPKYVIASVWCLWQETGRKNTPAGEAVELTMNDGTLVKLPNLTAEAAVWKDVVTGLQERLVKAGMNKNQLLIGQACDSHPRKEDVELFNAIDPGLRWSAWTHGYGYNGNFGENRNHVALFISPDHQVPLIRNLGRSNVVRPGNALVRLNSLRSHINGDEPVSLAWRMAPDGSACGQKQGVCHGYAMVGIDYWKLKFTSQDDKGRAKMNVGTLWGGPYPNLHYCRLDRGSPGSVTVAGPHGALPTVRSEALADGAQETEARLAIQVAKGGSMDAEFSLILKARYTGFTPDAFGSRAVPATLPATWHESLLELYELAGKLQKK